MEPIEGLSCFFSWAHYWANLADCLAPFRVDVATNSAWTFKDLDFSARSSPSLSSERPKEYASFVQRRGLSVVEMVLVIVVLAVVAIPFLSSFGSFTRGMHRTRRQTTATYLAQSVMEQILRRVQTESRQAPDFSPLAQAASNVVQERGAETSRYFFHFENLQGSGLHGIDPASDPSLFKQLELYQCKVTITQGAELGVDSDGDGNHEEDMFEVLVEVLWQNPKGGARSTQLVTMFTTFRTEGP